MSIKQNVYHQRYSLNWQQWQLFIAISLIILLGSGILLGSLALHQVRNRVEVFANELNLSITRLEQTPQNPGTAIVQAQRHLLAARAALEPFRPITEPVRRQGNDLVNMPGIGPLAAWWVFTDEVTLAIQELLSAAILLSEPSLKEATDLLAQSPGLKTHLQAAERHLRQAQSVRPLLDTGWLPDDMAPQAEIWLSQWDATVPLWRDGLPGIIRLLEELPAALGQPQPVTYLVVIQSSDNLRATGGFLTGIGTVTFEQGRITKIDIRDVVEAELQAEWTPEQGYLHSRILPPEPLRRYMGLGHWVLRDGNWWADFPTTARQIVQFWRLVKDIPVNGVIAITDQAIARLLEATGPISISGEMIHTQNMKAIAARRIYYGSTSISGNQQTAFFQEMASTLVWQLEQLPPSQWPALAQAIQIALRRHDILIASFDPALAQMLQDFHIDGAVQDQRGDFWYLVEDDLSDSKLSSFITQRLHYEVYLGDDGWPRLALLTIDKANTYTPGTGLPNFPNENYATGGRWDTQIQHWDRWEGYYGGYLRLFPPLESQLLLATGFDDNINLMTENDRPVFGSYVGLWAGAQRQLQFQWIPLGQPSKFGQYELLIQRQPGTLEYPLTVLVHLPPGYSATAITPSPTLVTKNEVTWEVILDQDQNFLLRLVQK